MHSSGQARQAAADDDDVELLCHEFSYEIMSVCYVGV